MEADFWHERWRRGEIGFHQDAYHHGLVRWWPTLGLPVQSRVFVPLCGKSLDMAWLREQGHVIAGIELSPLAVESFFGERGLAASRVRSGTLEKWSADGYEIWCGDFFSLTPEELGPVQGLYDRAAFHALPPAMRARYAAHLAALLPAGARGLLVSLEYPQHEMNGPPFSLSLAELEALTASHFSLAPLQTIDVLSMEPRFRDRGVTRMTETVYSIVRTTR
jgi:thiopurine S-methyltransferase